MVDEQHPVARQIVRYGVPVLILVFYLTASLGFEYTPDSPFLAFHHDAAAHQTPLPSPVWLLLLGVGDLFRLNPILTAKVFSIFFACMAILCAYLVAHEILNDRLLGLAAVLVVAMQSWLLQSAPSGSPFCLALLLTLGALFLLLRNEYLPASVAVALASLVFWEGAALMLFLLADVYINSREKRRAYHVMGGAVLVFLSMLLPWALFAWREGLSLVPGFIPLAEFPRLNLAAIAALALLGGLTMIGAVLLVRDGAEGRDNLRGHIVPWLCILWFLGLGVLKDSELWLLAIPLLVCYAFVGLRRLLLETNKAHLLYPAVFLVAGLLLAQSQSMYRSTAKGIMENATSEYHELRTIAYWLNVNTSEQTTIAGEKLGVLRHYAKRVVKPLRERPDPTVEYVVTSADNVAGFEQVYDPAHDVLGTSGVGTNRFTVWRRK